MGIFNKLAISDIALDIYDGPIGCSISGGVDSSVLAYILLKYAPGPINFYTTSSPYWPNRAEATRDVYQRLVNLVPREDVQLIETSVNDELPDEKNLFETIKSDLRSGKITMCYTGITSNPPGNLDFNQKDTMLNHRTGIRRITDGKFYMPWANIDKSKIAELYEHYDLTESIFPYTLSCVSSTTAEHCDDCWWCEERKWAFGRLV